MKEDKRMLNDEELESVDGGYLFNQSSITGAEDDVWEVIDDKTGNVIYTSKNLSVCLAYCRGLQQSEKEINYSQVLQLRRYGKIYSPSDIKG